MLVSVPQSKLLSSIAFVDNFILNVAKEWSVHFGFKPTDLATKHGIPRLIVSHHLSVSLRKGSYWIKLFHVLPVSLVDLNVFPPTTHMWLRHIRAGGGGFLWFPSGFDPGFESKYLLVLREEIHSGQRGLQEGHERV